MAASGDQNDIEGHGGDLGHAAAAFGDPQGGWIDLSTGINPRSYPVPDLSPEAWTRLPQAAALDHLKHAAAAAYGAAGPDLIACAPGTQALIQIMPRILELSRISVLGPTYSEHAAQWRRFGTEVDEVAGMPPPDGSLVVVNPNNPDGRCVAPQELAAWARDAAAQGHYLIVDEAFADVRPEISIVPAMPLANVVVLRSFGKFHGLAGLRLGVAVAAPDMAKRLEDEQGPWAVSGPALEIGARALADRPWAEAERAWLAAQMTRLRDLLSSAGLAIIGGTDLFVLAEHDRAAEFWAHLAARGILVRRFAENGHRLRFGLPVGDSAWGRLGRAVSEFAAPEAERRHG